MMVNKNSIFCVYMTPCNYCSKFDKPCDKICNDKRKPKKAEAVASSEASEKCSIQPENMPLRLPETTG